MQPAQVRKLREFYRRALLDDTVAFWVRHGIDRECGGFLTHLTREGAVYGTDKPIWFAGRGTWLFAELYRVYGESSFRELALHGARFLDAHGFDTDGRMYFLVDRTGRPLRQRRYHYSDVFAVLAYAALASIGISQYRERATARFDRLVHDLNTPDPHPKVNPAVRPTRSLSPVMCLLAVADAVQPIVGARAEAIIDTAVTEVFEHFVRSEDATVRETVSADGSLLDTPEGRVMNPGHAIETAWFMLEIARRRDDRVLLGRALKVLDGSLARGWDAEYGGLFYFIDVAGLPSPYLEHDMKLWWPHCEALYATLLAHHLTGDEAYADHFQRVHDWTFAHFPDPEHGEWFGYLRRDGSVASTMKGGLWKGPFHIPRAVMLCHQLLERM
jgi:N-acylglucosamine 2-epimerase